MNSNRKRNMNSNRKRNLIAVEKLARKGLSTKQISKKTGLSIWTVCRHINFLGLSKKPTEEQKENELKEIKKLLNSGLTPKDAAQSIDRSVMHIYRAMKKLGIKNTGKSIRGLCRENGVSFDSVNSLRKRKGLSVTDAIEAAKTTNKIKWKYEGYEGLPAIAKGLGLSYASLAHTIYELKVKDIEDAIEIVKVKQRKTKIRKTKYTPTWKLALGITA